METQALVRDVFQPGDLVTVIYFHDAYFHNQQALPEVAPFLLGCQGLLVQSSSLWSLACSVALDESNSGGRGIG